MVGEEIRVISCKCGNWEEMPADEQRHHSQTFTFKAPKDNNEAMYECDCGEEVMSECIIDSE